MKFARTIKGRPPERHPLTCGFGEPSLDQFTDVKRALHNWLIRNSDDYRRNSELSRARNLKQKQHS